MLQPLLGRALGTYERNVVVTSNYMSWASSIRLLARKLIIFCSSIWNFKLNIFVIVEIGCWRNENLYAFSDFCTENIVFFISRFHHIVDSTFRQSCKFLLSLYTSKCFNHALELC